MTDDQKYLELLKALAEMIYSKNITINSKDYEINRLRQLLEAAEAQANN